MRGEQPYRGVRSVDLDSTVVVTFSAPDVQTVRDGVLVTARLWNEGSADAHSIAWSELVRDGRILDKAAKPIDVPAHTAFTFTQEFTILDTRHGTHTVRVRFQPYPQPEPAKFRKTPRSSTPPSGDSQRARPN